MNRPTISQNFSRSDTALGFAAMDFKRWLVAARYYATIPSRRMRNTFLSACGRAPLMVLFYHRVADSHPNDWTISCDLFRRQMCWLRRHFDLISLSEAQRRIRSGCNMRPAVCVTFDDGYADNCDFALPYLRDEKIPCTYFVASQNVLTGTPFPHDIQAGVELSPNTPEQIAEWAEAGVEIGAHTRTHCDLGKITDARTVVQRDCRQWRRVGRYDASRDSLLRISLRPAGEHDRGGYAYGRGRGLPSCLLRRLVAITSRGNPTSSSAGSTATRKWFASRTG